MRRTGLVLAGGGSRRFGEAKALVPFDGKPMVERVCEVLATRCDEVLVSVAADADARMFEAVTAGAKVVRDVQHDHGPIEGFREGFTVAQGELVFVAPSDAPLLRPELYDGLHSLLGDHEAAVPRHDALDPVRALYRRDAVLRVLREDGVRSPSALVDRLDAVFLEGELLRSVDPSRVSFLDVNRREDLETARRASARESAARPTTGFSDPIA